MRKVAITVMICVVALIGMLAIARHLRHVNTGIIRADPMTPEAETYLGIHQAILEQEKRD